MQAPNLIRPGIVGTVMAFHPIDNFKLFLTYLRQLVSSDLIDLRAESTNQEFIINIVNRSNGRVERR